MKLERLSGPKHRQGTHRRAVAAGGLTLALALSACGAKSDDATDNKPIENLRVVAAFMPTSLDPDSTNINDIYTNYQVAAQYMGTLVRIRPSEGSGDKLTFPDDLHPELAESIEPGDKGYTVTLRDVTSPAGNRLTSEDVKWSFERMVANQSVAMLLLDFARVDLKNPITIKDEKTFVINTTTPTTLLPSVLENAALGIFDSVEAKKHATPDDPWAREWLKNNTASFGPYTVEKFDPGNEVTLKAHSGYWSGSPKIQTVTIRNVPDAASRAQLLQSGSADLMLGVPPTEWAALEKNAKIQTVAMGSPSALEIWLNTTKEPTNNVALRRAIANAINKEDIAKGLFPGVGAPVADCTAATVPVAGFTSAVPNTGNLEEAKAQLAKAGLDRPLQMIYNSATNVFSESAARFVQDQLKQVGIEVKLNAYANQADYQTAMDKREWDLNLGVQSLFINHPLYELKMFLTGTSSLNIPAYNNKTFADLVDKALGSSETEELTRQACEIAINDDVPLILIMSFPYTVALDKNVPGARSYPYDRIPFADLG